MNEMEEWLQENFREKFPDEDPKRYHFERQMFMLIWYDYVHMECDLPGRYPSEACDILPMAWYTALSYSWVI